MDSIQPNQRLQMPTNTAYRKIDMNANNKIDQIFTVEKETCDVYRYADFDEDGFVDLLTDYKNDTNTIYNKDGSIEVHNTSIMKNEGAFNAGDFMMSQRVPMPSDNARYINKLDKDKNGTYEESFVISDYTGWILRYIDNNDDSIADKVVNYHERVMLEWKEDGTCIASDLDEYTTQTDYNGDNIAEVRSEHHPDGLW